MRRHQEVIKNFEHYSPGFTLVDGGDPMGVCDASQELIDFMAKTMQPLYGTYFRQIYFSRDRPTDIQKIFRDWAHEVVRLVYRETTPAQQVPVPDSVAIHTVIDPTEFTDFIASNQHDPFANWHTDSHESVDHINGIDVHKLSKAPRRVLVFGGPGTLAIEGLVKAQTAQHFMPPHSRHITKVNDLGAYPHVLVGADDQFYRGPVKDTAERATLEGDYTTIEAPTETWVDLPPTCVHAVPEKVPPGRTIVIINPPYDE